MSIWKTRNLRLLPLALGLLITTPMPARPQAAVVTVPFATLARNRFSPIMQKKNAVVTNAQDWQKLLRKLNLLGTALPEIDFSTQTVIAVFNGEAGDANNMVEITKVEKIGKTYQVSARENHTHPTCPPPPPVSSASFHLIVVERIKNPESRVTFMPHEHQSIPCR
ncbi:MAG: hypothetical protein HY231_21760 [Acidobacteria bacterium]|nr:hypothetical protein [Acidobacteriota bacterium]